MFGYCPGCDDVLADIGPGEGVCLDCYIDEVRARLWSRESSKNCIRGDGMIDETAAAHPCSKLRGIYFKIVKD